ncbi:MAG: hypothetical protein A2Y12_04560 [Planctomycetes bacterium GWF2_42_9]|nr:MAG: hypothetical protein A2Y12_04560 [Planctomycetes bacterium GWF2_42_9]HAL45219.1 hypothetical protein [Phycisphaerales bacterium]
MKKYLLISVVVLASQIALAEQAAPVLMNDQITQLEAKVENLIVNDHNFTAALNEYVAAAKANPQEVYYRQQYAVLQRVVKMQNLIKTEINLEKWKSYAKAIRGYYYNKGFYSEALAIDLQAANKFNTGEFAANALETMLLNGKNAEAVKFIEEKKTEDKIVRYETLSLAAQALNGKAKESVDALQTVKIDPKLDSKSYFDIARIYNAAGDKEKTLANLQLLLENTLPSEIEAERLMIKRTADLASLNGSDDFTKVLATQSKVEQSGCTGGSSCGSCKNRSKCSSTKN